MIRTFFFWMIFWDTVIFGLVISMLLSPFYRKRDVLYHLARFGLRIALRVGGIKVRISGLENVPQDENVIFLANHQSGLDTVILLVFLPRYFRFVAMQDIFAVPLLRDYITRLGFILVDQRDPKQSLIATRRIINLLRSGETMTIFPEGTRSPDERLLEFRVGTAMLVLEAKKPIVPIAISGSWKVMQRDELYGLRLRPGPVRVNVGKAFSLPQDLDVNLDSARRANARIKEAIESLKRNAEPLR